MPQLDHFLIHSLIVPRIEREQKWMFHHDFNNADMQSPYNTTLK